MAIIGKTGGTMGASLRSIRDSHFNFITITDSSVSNDFFLNSPYIFPTSVSRTTKKERRKVTVLAKQK